jgi:hypothetical protein
MSNLIERVQGQGKVFSGERMVADVRYNVRVHQHYQESMLLSGQTTRTPIYQSIELDLSERVEGGFDEPLTLHMSDGRKLNFWALGGKYTATGGMY